MTDSNVNTQDVENIDKIKKMIEVMMYYVSDLERNIKHPEKVISSCHISSEVLKQYITDDLGVIKDRFDNFSF